MKLTAIHAEVDVSQNSALLDETVEVKAEFNATPVERDVQIRPAVVWLQFDLYSTFLIAVGCYAY